MKIKRHLVIFLFLTVLFFSQAICLALGGNLDPTFGTGGFATTDAIGPSNDSAKAIAIQADGKIIVAGVLTFMQGCSIQLEHR